MICNLQYPAIGRPRYAAEAGRLLVGAGFGVGMDERRGLDHCAWVPMRYLLPDTDVPVFQVSMPHALDTTSAFQFGRALAPIRESGVMIVGSGGMTHNLYEFRQSGSDAAGYATEFTQWVRQAVTSNDIERLVNYRQLAPHAQRAHPTQEHFLPLLVALGACAEGGATLVRDGGIANGVLSMESYAWGLADGRIGTITH